MSEPGDLSVDALVEQAGVSPAFVDRLVDLGIVAPADGRYGAADVYRVRMMEACDRSGMPAEAIAEAIEAGSLSLAYLDRPQYHWPTLADETYREMADRSGLSIDLVQQVWAALGSDRPSPDARVRDDDAPIFELIRLAAPFVSREALVRLGRVYVDGFRRMAEAEAVFFDTQIVGGLMRSGMSYGEAVEMGSVAGEQMNPLQEQLLLALYRRQQERAWTQGLIEGIERVIDAMGSYEKPERPPAFSFIDLAGYTQTTERQGDEVGARLAADLADLVARLAGEHGGMPVKWLGDGVMVRFEHAGDAVRATLAIVDAVPALGLPAHAGIASGPVVMQDGDYFGRTVNLAARIAASSTPGQTLVSPTVLELADDPSIRFVEVGPIGLKGFDEPVVVFEARLA